MISINEGLINTSKNAINAAKSFISGTVNDSKNLWRDTRLAGVNLRKTIFGDFSNDPTIPNRAAAWNFFKGDLNRIGGEIKRPAIVAGTTGTGLYGLKKYNDYSNELHDEEMKRIGAEEAIKKYAEMEKDNANNEESINNLISDHPGISLSLVTGVPLSAAAAIYMHNKLKKK